MKCWRMDYKIKKLLKRHEKSRKKVNLAPAKSTTEAVTKPSKLKRQEKAGKKVKLNLDKNAYIDELDRKCVNKCKLTEFEASSSKISLTLSLLLQAITMLMIVTDLVMYL